MRLGIEKSWEAAGALDLQAAGLIPYFLMFPQRFSCV